VAELFLRSRTCTAIQRATKTVLAKFLQTRACNMYLTSTLHPPGTTSDCSDDEFIVDFELLYVQRDPDRLHFVRPCVHALIHLGLEVPQLGPPSLYSAWTMERTIRNLGEEIRQPSNPYANLSERGLKHCQVNVLRAMLSQLQGGKGSVFGPRGSMALGGGYMLLRAQERMPHTYDGVIGVSITAYMATHGIDLNGMTSIRLTRWAWLQLPNGQIARSAWNEETRPIDETRRSCCVKVSYIIST
jgi:hypothetical protein